MEILKYLKNLFSTLSEIAPQNKAANEQKQPEKREYTVKNGDTLYSIAKANGISCEELKKANGLKKDGLSIGQTMTIPEAKLLNKNSQSVFESKIIKEEGFSYDKEAPPAKINGPAALYSKPSIHKIKSGETLSSIEKKYGLRQGELADNNKNLGNTLSIGQSIKIPEHVQVHNIKSTQDVAEATGLSVSFLKKLEEFEGKNHSMKGNPTIGTGHYPFSNFDKKYYATRRLNDTEINRLLAQDLIKAQSKIKQQIGEGAYNKLNQKQREALTDFVFNRGESTFASKECKPLRDALMKGNYSVVAANLDHNTDYNTKEVEFGLSKRRLFEMSHFCDGKFDKTILKAAQRVYDEGREAARKKGTHKNIIYGNNKEILEMFNGQIKVKP